jgi:hypothetical protein
MLQKNKPVKIEGRLVDGRYKKGVDKGAMSSQTIPLPLKSIEKKEPIVFVPHYKKLRPDKYNPDGTEIKRKRKKK